MVNAERFLHSILGMLRSQLVLDYKTCSFVFYFPALSNQLLKMKSDIACYSCFVASKPHFVYLAVVLKQEALSHSLMLYVMHTVPLLTSCNYHDFHFLLAEPSSLNSREAPLFCRRTLASCPFFISAA